MLGSGRNNNSTRNKVDEICDLCRAFSSTLRTDEQVALYGCDGISVCASRASEHESEAHLARRVTVEAVAEGFFFSFLAKLRVLFLALPLVGKAFLNLPVYLLERA